MKFFFPDSQDQVDPSFDFLTETRDALRSRQRDDRYAHEVFRTPPFDGYLVSKAIVDGSGEGGARYGIAQRHRLFRQGVRAFFRLGDRPLETFGDCGAFTYVREETPPYSVDEVVDFYEECGFDHGVSIDHVILGYSADDDPEPDWEERQAMTLELASQFRKRWRARRCRFNAIGVAQGWSPRSYATAAKKLQRMGYRRIAIGGLVPLKTPEILSVLAGVSDVRRSDTELHLFGVTRCEHVVDFAGYGVTSFDSTSPLRQAFMDDKNNYWTASKSYMAARVPQVDGNAALKRRIRAGEIAQGKARELERACLDMLRKYDKGRASLKATVAALGAYEELHSPKKNRDEGYRDLLRDRPWQKCSCAVCRDLGIEVVIFRGAERNRRRGFHNLTAFRKRLNKNSKGVKATKRTRVAAGRRA